MSKKSSEKNKSESSKESDNPFEVEPDEIRFVTHRKEDKGNSNQN